MPRTRTAHHRRIAVKPAMGKHASYRLMLPRRGWRRRRSAVSTILLWAIEIVYVFTVYVITTWGAMGQPGMSPIPCVSFTNPIGIAMACRDRTADAW